MLPKRNRLAKIRDFNLLFGKGRWINGHLFDLKAADLEKNNAGKHLKLAINVGLKVSKSAVVRNRIKRQAREVVGTLIKEERLKTNHHILLNARKEAVGRNFAEISHDIELILAKAGVLC